MFRRFFTKSGKRPSTALVPFVGAGSKPNSGGEVKKSGKSTKSGEVKHSTPQIAGLKRLIAYRMISKIVLMLVKLEVLREFCILLFSRILIVVQRGRGSYVYAREIGEDDKTGPF